MLLIVLLRYLQAGGSYVFLEAPVRVMFESPLGSPKLFFRPNWMHSFLPVSYYLGICVVMITGVQSI